MPSVNARRSRLKTGEAMGAASAWGGVAHFSGVMLQVTVEAGQVRAALPSPLRLGAAPDGASGGHPLLVLAGELSDGGVHLGDLDLNYRVRYREVALLVPRVEHPLCPGSAVFVERMYADAMTPVFWGNACYGLRKQLAEITWQGPRLAVWNQGREVFACSGSLQGPWRVGSGPEAPQLGGLPRWLGAPILGRRDSGAFVRLGFELGFGGAQSCDFNLHQPLRVRGLRVWPGATATAFAVRGLRWRTTPPARMDSAMS